MWKAGTPWNWVALNGANYSLNQFFFDSNVEVHPELWWTPRKVDRFAQFIDEPTAVIGFSRGATAAARLARKCPWIRLVIAHSPMVAGAQSIVPCPLMVFRTVGDRTPCGLGSRLLYRFNEGLGASFNELDQAPWQIPPQTDQEAIMERLGHQFHNLLPILHEEFPELWE